MNQIIILIALVKFPSSEATYLTAGSYVISKEHHSKELAAAKEDFRSHVETDGFLIVSMLLYIVPKEQVADVT